MGEADEIVVEALLDDVLDDGMVTEAVDVALEILQGDDGVGVRLGQLEKDLASITREHTNLMAAIRDGERISGLVDALRALDRRREGLEAERSSIATQSGIRASDSRRVREELLELASSWRTVLADDPTHARPIISSLLKGRVTFAPIAPNRWRLTGNGTLIGLFSKEWTGRGHVPNGIRTRVL